MKIEKVFARQVLDSRGNPTIEAVVVTDKKGFSAMVPSGASTGKFEALELRDNSKEFHGKSVLKAVENVNKVIAPKILGLNPENQRDIDSLLLELDGTENKSVLGANAVLSVSLAVSRAGAYAKSIPLYEHLNELSGRKKMFLPAPQLNVVNGGLHAGLKNDIQETMIFPLGFKSFSDALRAGVETYHELKALLKKRFGSTAVLVGDEGGFAPKLKSFEDRLDLVLRAVTEAGYEKKVFLALDPASSEFFSDSSYTYSLEDTTFTSNELVDFYSELVKKYPIVSIEDGMAEIDWLGWQELTSKLGNKIQLVGDDLLVTNVSRIREALEKKCCNALLLKVNQVGSLSESLDAAELSFENKWNVIVSHRSGETEDSFIADLAVGLGCGQSKFGACARSERNSKYNRLLAIEQELGEKAVFRPML